MNDKPASMQIRIEKLVTGGGGLGHDDGQAVFVPLTAPGDLVEAVPVRQAKNFVQAKLVEILEPGEGRRVPPCPHFGDCGGCDLQHLEAVRQRSCKQEILLDCFTRLGKLDVADILGDTLQADNDLGYRNRIRVYANPAGHYGLMRQGTHEVVPITGCPLLPELFNTTIWPWLTTLPPVEQMIVRLDNKGRWLASMFGPPQRLRLLKKIIASLNSDEVGDLGCQGVLFNNLPIWGRDYLVQEVAGHSYRVGAQSFFQANLAVTELAVATVRSWLTELRDQGRLGPLLGDFFCGVGLFSLALADLFEQVIALDTNPYACRDARNNVQRDPAARDRVTVRQGDLPSLLARSEPDDQTDWRGACCLLDPPRTGLGKEGLQTILQLPIRHLVYMSCDPATLARDAKALLEVGYKPLRLVPVDMFPQSAHIESLMLLERT